MKIESVMTSSVHCLRSDASLQEAAKLMRALNLGCLPVCDHEGLIGIITDRDLAIRAMANALNAEVTPVADVMTQGLLYVYADQEVSEAIQVMEQTQVRRLPVLNRAHKVVGILSLTDIAREVSAELGGGTLRVISAQDVPFFERDSDPQVSRNSTLQTIGTY